MPISGTVHSQEKGDADDRFPRPLAGPGEGGQDHPEPAAQPELAVMTIAQIEHAVMVAATDPIVQACLLGVLIVPGLIFLLLR